ncbi:DKNYY domain-containing protein, partial [Desulfobulbus sp. US2]|nr:DKNYY domain-containing protein [Desulfobulbus sp. US2]
MKFPNNVLLRGIGLCCSATAFFLLAPSMSREASLGKCYHRSGDSIEISYQGGYPRSKIVHKKVKGADPKSFYLIADVQDDNCGLAPLYGADDKQVFFRNKRIPGADPVSFIALGSSYGRDRLSLYYQERMIAG